MNIVEGVDLGQLKAHIEKVFDKKVQRVMIQADLFKGFDEVACLLEGGDMYRCLVSDGVQASEWSAVPKQEVR